MTYLRRQHSTEQLSYHNHPNRCEGTYTDVSPQKRMMSDHVTRSVPLCVEWISDFEFESSFCETD